MKFNISYPQTGAQICVDVDDDNKCAPFFDQRMGAEIPADTLGDQFKGYVFKITGGNDKDGFPMKQGVLVKGRVRLLLGKGSKTYRPRRSGERKRKSVRGCIVGNDIRVLSVAVAKKGESEIPNLTDKNIPRRLGPKRLTKLRRLFNFQKSETELVKSHVVRRTWTAKNGHKRQKAPKIQRLVTQDRLRRKRIFKKEKKALWDNRRKAIEEYQKVLHDWHKKQNKSTEPVVEEKPKVEAKTDKKQADKAKTTTTTKVPVQQQKPVQTKTVPTKTAPTKTQPQTVTNKTQAPQKTETKPKQQQKK